MSVSRHGDRHYYVWPPVRVLFSLMILLLAKTVASHRSFDAPNTTCYLAQYYNAVYVMNGDSSDTSAVYIYDAAKKSWSKQSVTAGKFDPSNFAAILDHDTNVFYAVSGSDLFFLNMGAETSANSTALAWTDVEQTPFGSSYQPVMALAQNHIHFLDVPNVSAGDAKIFVIHCEFSAHHVRTCISRDPRLLLPTRRPIVPRLKRQLLPGRARKDGVVLPERGRAAGIRVHSR